MSRQGFGTNGNGGCTEGVGRSGNEWFYISEATDFSGNKYRLGLERSESPTKSVCVCWGGAVSELGSLTVITPGFH